MKRFLFVTVFCVFTPLVTNPALAELPPETLTVQLLKEPNPHRLYLTDLALGHVIDGRVHVIDGDNYDYLGLISTGLFGLTALSPDSSLMYVATTYYTKRNRGRRFDQFEIYSTKDLTLQAEIEIPAKHAHALPYKGTMIGSKTGKFVFIQNATPASSISVVNVEESSFVTEIPTPGCWISLPSITSEKHVSSLCGDGTLLTVSLDAEGKSVDQKRSAAIFDGDLDPLFVQAEAIGDTYYFVSYQGMVHEINVEGPVAKSVAKWSLLDENDKQEQWRPGGYQLLAVNKAQNLLYVAMHKEGRDGSHKWPAQEIWVYNVKSQKRVDRAPGGNSVAMTLTKEEKPLLFLYDGVEAKFHKYQTTPKLKKIDDSPPFGEFAGLVESH